MICFCLFFLNAYCGQLERILRTVCSDTPYSLSGYSVQFVRILRTVCSDTPYSLFGYSVQFVQIQFTLFPGASPPRLCYIVLSGLHRKLAGLEALHFFRYNKLDTLLQNVIFLKKYENIIYVISELKKNDYLCNIIAIRTLLNGI